MEKVNKKNFKEKLKAVSFHYKTMIMLNVLIYWIANKVYTLDFDSSIERLIISYKECFLQKLLMAEVYQNGQT